MSIKIADIIRQPTAFSVILSDLDSDHANLIKNFDCVTSKSMTIEDPKKTS